MVKSPYSLALFFSISDTRPQVPNSKCFHAEELSIPLLLHPLRPNPVHLNATVSEATHVPCFPFAKGFLRCRRVLQLSPARRGSTGGIGSAVDTGWEEWGLVVSVRYSNPHQGPVLLQNTGSTTSFSRGVKNAGPMSITNTASGFGR
jgi:hypothetical protein